MNISNKITNSTYSAKGDHIIAPKPGNNSSSKTSSEAIEEIKITSIWHKLAGKYDVRKMTKDDMSYVSQQLFEAGEISSTEHSILSFNPSKSNRQTTTSIYRTPTDNDGNRDWITEYAIRYQQAQNSGNQKIITVNQSILSHLSRLEAVKKGPLNIKA